MEERRREARYPVIDLDLYLREPEEKVGRVVNLSENGLLSCVDVKTPPDVGETIQYRVPFKKSVAGQVYFDFEAKVVWVRDKDGDDGPENYDMGLAFVDHAELQLTFIRHMIRLYAEE